MQLQTPIPKPNSQAPIPKPIDISIPKPNYKAQFPSPLPKPIDYINSKAQLQSPIPKLSPLLPRPPHPLSLVIGLWELGERETGEKYYRASAFVVCDKCVANVLRVCASALLCVTSVLRMCCVITIWASSSPLVLLDLRNRKCTNGDRC